MVMPRHLIVSCGTSQIDKNKLGSKGFKLPASLIRDCSKLEFNKDLIDDNSIKSFASVSEVIQVRDSLIKCWGEMSDMAGKPNNPFGAELSTLEQMKKKGWFDPDNDSITVLYSDTKIGAYCAAILDAVLKQGWQMDGRVYLKRILDWKEDPKDAGESEKNLCQSVLASIKQHNNANSDLYLVVTGGFKSMIPFFTLIALKKDLEMYYLFEDTANLRCIKIPATLKTKARTFWQEAAATFGIGSNNEERLLVEFTGGLKKEPEEKAPTPPTE
ncbi:MAG: hypothetical protein IPM66_22320 [Acidobacteriota bacterium]|nr:MAG: hypothetical protein IPM66_22320 [Acidobacteriota bacterium]